MPDLPKCPNFVRKRGCPRSEIQLLGENEDAWTFRCSACELIWVCSKPNSIMGGKERAAQEQLRKEAEMRRLRDSRTIYFT